jgi:drug/metabolite transporter (DMT)-like permease
VIVLNERLTLQAGSLALLTAILWGGNSIAIKVALDGLPPLALAAARFLLGGMAVMLWAIYARIPLRPGSGERRGLFQLVLLFIAQIYLLNAGTHFTTAGRSTVFISTYPFFTAVFAHLFMPGDRLSRLKITGMTLSFLGVVLVFAESLTRGDLGYLPGDVMVLMSGLLLGARQVYTKKLTQYIHPARLLLWQAALSLPVFILLSAFLENQIPSGIRPDIVGAIFYQGLVVAGFCFLISVSLLRRYRASRLGVFGFVTPVVGVVFSDLLLGEAISPTLLASVLLVGIGVAIVNSET